MCSFVPKLANRLEASQGRAGARRAVNLRQCDWPARELSADFMCRISHTHPVVTYNKQDGSVCLTAAQGEPPVQDVGKGTSFMSRN